MFFLGGFDNYEVLVSSDVDEGDRKGQGGISIRRT